MANCCILILVVLITATCCHVATATGCDHQRDGYLCKFYRTCGQSFLSSKAGYILHGTDVKPGEFPSFAQLVLRAEPGEETQDNVCSAVIVSDRHIATAAHCMVRKFVDLGDYAQKPVKFIKPSNIEVYVGEHRNIKFVLKDGRNFPARRVKSYCVHSQYTIDSLSVAGSDAALLTLEEPLRFDEFIQPACWPYDVDKIDLSSSRSQCFQVGIGVSGWEPALGFTGIDKAIVQKMRIGAMSCPAGLDAVCSRGIGRHSGAAACFGDSGGPALCFRKDTRQWTVVGLMSRFYGAALETPCPAGSETASAFPGRELDLTTLDGCPEVWLNDYTGDGGSDYSGDSDY